MHIWELTTERANLSILVSFLRFLSPPTQDTDTLQMVAIASIIYVPLTAFAKVPILLFYRRLSDNLWYSVAVWLTLGTIILFSVATIFALVFACTPMERNWDITINQGQCLNRGAVYVAIASANTATNLALLLLPVPVIMSMTSPTPQKFGLLFVFGIGAL